MGDDPNAMNPAPSEQAVFAEALLRDTPEARAAFLACACGTDTALFRRVENLLRAAERAGDFLEQPPEGLHEIELREKPGDRIGRYKLLEKIGEGGCGVVYMAEQEEPVRRRVALKVIKLGMDTRSVIARFEAERQALALMEHPNIAQVFDGGATPTGRPYFVMELVRGTRITDFCDEAQLSTEARLRLFAQVCQAIQHAHQKGVIHRDLKPSNILVTVNDGVPVPKGIDFGIAKATGARLTDKTLCTQFHSFIGTPAYTSPEQAEMSSVDIDTRSDIYSLGVLLYELLTGRTPFDGEKLLSAGLDEMRRIIRDDQPLRPSSRLDTLGLAEATELSGKRKASLPELAGDVRGDLDWIAMKCLEKDRARRYETASGLAADIQRHLEHEPVLARPPSGLYLLQKLAQRNRGALIAAITVLVALLVALFTLATSNARIRQERNQKTDALRERGVALEAAHASEERAREQLFVSLQSQARARRQSRQPGQRLESLAALAEAARIRPTPELRDNAIAAMALADVAHGPIWSGWSSDAKAVAYDPHGQRYASLEADGTIRVRTVPDHRELQRLPPVPALSAGTAIRYFQFSPDGRFLAWLAANGQLGLWRWESGASVLKSSPEKCAALAFSPDSRRFAVGHEEWITCLDLGTGEISQAWRARDQVHALDFHPDSRRIAVGYETANAIAIYNSDDGERVANFPAGGSSMNVVAWHPEGEVLAAGGSDPRVQIWHVPTKRKVAVLEGHFQQVNFLRFHWSGEMLASMSWDGALRLWQPSPGRLLLRLPSRPMDFSQPGPWAGIISPSNQQAQLWGLVPSREYQTFLNTFREGESVPREGDISPDGALLALAASDGVRLWDVARGREVAWLRTADTTSAWFRADGRTLLTCGLADGLRCWPIEASTKPEGGWQVGLPRPIPLPFAPTRMTKSRDDRMLAVTGEQAGECVQLDLATETVRGAALPHAMVGYVAMSAGAKRLATSGWHSERVKVWDGTDGKLIQEWAVGVSACVFVTPDNRELVVARDREFAFYDLETLKINRRMAREMGLYPGHIAFTSDEKMMALEMAPGVIHLKEIEIGRAHV